LTALCPLKKIINKELRTGAVLSSLECYYGNMNNVIENVSHLLSEYLSVMQQQQYKSKFSVSSSPKNLCGCGTSSDQPEDLSYFSIE